MAVAVTNKGSYYISALLYAKTLTGFSTHHPSIVTDQETYTEYFDYYVGSTGELFILLIRPKYARSTNSTYEVVVVDPSTITTVSFDSELGLDMAVVPVTSRSFNSRSLFTTIMNSAVTGSSNTGVPYLHLEFDIGSTWYILDNVKYHNVSRPFLVIEVDAISLGAMTSVKQDNMVFYEDVMAISVPLIDIERVGLDAYCPAEVLTALENLKKSWGLVEAAGWIPPTERAAKLLPVYKRGDRVRHNDGVTYISTVNENTVEPGSPEDTEGDWIIAMPKDDAP